jgi:nicotinate-nucleotide adenylyltransferase
VSERIAVFGGSFDPPHLGHTLAAAYVLARHAPDRLLVVPTRAHPFDKKLAAFEQRLSMCELAMRSLQRVEVSPIEGELELPSLTVRMLEALQRRLPQAQLQLVIGSDLIAETASWHNFERVKQLAPPLVVPRSGHLPAGSPPDAPALPAISSTRVRERVARGESIDDWVCPEVAQHIATHGLYR